MPCCNFDFIDSYLIGYKKPLMAEIWCKCNSRLPFWVDWGWIFTCIHFDKSGWDFFFQFDVLRINILAIWKRWTDISPSPAPCFSNISHLSVKVKNGIEGIEFFLPGQQHKKTIKNIRQTSNLAPRKEIWDARSCTSSTSLTFMLILLFVFHFISSLSRHFPPSSMCAPPSLISSHCLLQQRGKHTRWLVDKKKFVSFEWERGKCGWQACLGGEGGERKHWDENLMEKWWKSHINAWVNSECETLAERWREEEINIDTRIREILWQWVKLKVWNDRRKRLGGKIRGEENV